MNPQTGPFQAGPEAHILPSGSVGLGRRPDTEATVGSRPRLFEIVEGSPSRS